MPRGRKKAEVPMLEFYTNELNRLTILEKEQIANLETCRVEIKKYKDLILQEQMKEIKAIMDEKGITFDNVIEMLENHGQAVNSEKEVIGE